MSGVFPGTRTQTYQRVRLEPAGGGEPFWALVLWYDDPPSCVLYRQDAATSRLGAEALLRIPGAPGHEATDRLDEALAGAGLRLRACGSCAYWRPSAAQSGDGLPAGRCRLGASSAAAAEIPEALAVQSQLALPCEAWSAAPTDGRAAESALSLSMPTLPRIAVTTESKLKPWKRWIRRAMRSLRPAAREPALADLLAERSGVGAGTEPCLACQGRIANLGALTVESHEGDKQTFSVWRCRQCATLYLSNWIDRWERVESLETEEWLYRIAPAEAAVLLRLFGSVPAGDHPLGRQMRSPQRDWILEQIRERTPMSHVVKQGR